MKISLKNEDGQENKTISHKHGKNISKKTQLVKGCYPKYTENTENSIIRK